MRIARARVAFGMCVPLFLIARTAAADCVFTMRPPNAQEKQSYADAFALFFHRMAPPPPAGWNGSSGPKDSVLESVCALRERR